MASTPPPAPPSPDGAPWWRHGLVWMLIAGPAIVVVAGFVTLWLAMRTPDPVVDENYYQSGININQKLAEKQRALTPAMQGRNHTSTPTEDLPAPRR